MVKIEKMWSDINLNNEVSLLIPKQLMSKKLID